MSNKCWSCLKITIIVFLTLFGIIFTGIGAFFVYTMYHTKSTCINWGRYKYAHRSNTDLFQENSLEAILSTVDKNIGAEFNIFQISTGELIVFHDENAKELTGVDLDIETAKWDQIKVLKSEENKDISKIFFGVV